MASKKLAVLAGQEPLFDLDTIRGPKGLKALKELRTTALKCTKCSLSEARTLVVFGAGRLSPQVAFVGEAPGEHEDNTGVPFVGKSGHLLTKMIDAMGLSRDEVFLTNACLCRPPGNRPPTVSELSECREYLYGQLRAVTPRVIVCLGRSAALAVLRDVQALDYMRMRWHEWEGVPVRVTYHPAFLDKPEGAGFKAHTWLDLQAVMARVGLALPTKEVAVERVQASRGTGFDF